MASKKTSSGAPGAQPQIIQTYGFPLKPGLRQIEYDRAAFSMRLPVDRGAPPRYELFKKLAEQFLPGHFQYHDWTRSRLHALCDNEGKQTHLVAMPGCSGAGKTYDVAGFAVIWWLAEPACSSVMFVSTTRESLRKRGWAEIQKCYTSIPLARLGNFVDSKMMWQMEKGDAKNAIYGKAVEEGSTAKVADDIKGIHTRRQMVVIDEATAVPEAIWDACNNLYSYPEEFILVSMANPRNRLDRFARFMEPKEGWLSVGVDDQEWEGKPQQDFGGAVVKVIRCDAERSPNIIHGRIVSEHLPTKEEVEAARAASGGGVTPNYWTNKRGFPPPEGMTKTVFTESLLLQHRAKDRLTFLGGGWQIIGVFDMAFGGNDRPIMRFARMGTVAGNKWGIQAFPPITVPVSVVKGGNPIDYQLVEFAQRKCAAFVHEGVEYTCPPENFAFDSTGRGAAVVSIAQRTWSYRVIGIDFGGAASEDSVNLEDVRPACEVFRNKRSEMWFRSRYAIEHEQMKGLDDDTAQELCNMEFEDIATDGRSKLIILMAKKDYREKYRKSPDYGDAWAMLCEVARRKGFKLAPIGQTQIRSGDFDDTIKKTQALFDNIEYRDEELDDFEQVEQLM